MQTSKIPSDVIEDPFDKSLKLADMLKPEEPLDMDESNLSASNYFSNKDLISENEAKAELLTDEIIQMMVYSDIIENQTHPYRSMRILLDNRHKFPFNKPFGIEVSVKSVDEISKDIVAYLL